MSHEVPHITSLDHLNKILAEAGNKLVVIDAFATWCGPCKAIAPKVEELAKKGAGAYLVYKLDVDEAEDAAVHLSISAMPTFLFYKNGVEVHKFMGASVEKLEQAINDFK